MGGEEGIKRILMKVVLTSECFYIGRTHCSNILFQDSNSIKYYGEKLVGARIKMWWPLDQK